jgi:murein DD-endopeptidase MepM/ murein hydrolase activator NlpD
MKDTQDTTTDMISRPISRRAFLYATGATTAAVVLWPGIAQAKVAPALPALIDPYSGSIALVFPLPRNSYQTHLQNNWHQAREGQIYEWNHRNATTARAHDGVDVYPRSANALPWVYAPLAARVAAVCTRSDNTLNATVTYQVSATTPPPWDYSQGVDNVANLPLYGDFVWLYSTDARSAGYFIFYCHLQNEAIVRSLVPDQVVTTATPVGVMGDTGNAQGAPQLHVEIHYPAGNGYTCTHCSPNKAVTGIDPFNSLATATKR